MTGEQVYALVGWNVVKYGRGRDWDSDYLAILRTIHEHSLLWHGLKPHPGPLLAKEREVC
jgi:hypothetical protein